MKKHIVIAGVPRAGKSTASGLIAKRYGHRHVMMDTIIAGFERCFPELNINTYADMPSLDILFHISGRIAPFINAMMHSEGAGNDREGMVIDVYQLLPEDCRRHIDPALCDVHFLITADVTPLERFELQRKYDTPKDYTYHKSDEELMEGCEYLVGQSRLIRRQCLEYGFPCHETSTDRESVLEALIQSLAHSP